MKLQFCIPMLFALAALAPKADAGVMLSLTSTSDLTSLEVGDTFVVNVELSGLTGELSTLGADINIPSQFATPSLPVAGAIVPASAIFIPFTAPDRAVGQSFADGFPFFDPATFITSDGTFFSFELEVVAEGSGEIDYFFTTAFAPGAPPEYFPETLVILETNSLPFSVGASSVVPEPASIAGFLMLGVVALGYRKKRQSGCDEGLHA